MNLGTSSPFIGWLFCLFTAFSQVNAQEAPKYTKILFLTTYDSLKLPPNLYPENGLSRSYFNNAHTSIFDLDDNQSTYIKFGIKALLCVECTKENNKRIGLCSFYLIDSLDYNKRYKIWEQDYANDKLHGQWRTYTLRGGLVNYQTFSEDSINGIAKQYWIDGKTVMEETMYFNSRDFDNKEYFWKGNGNLQMESSIRNGKLNGIAKKYYENGSLEEVANFKNGQFEGNIKYFYPNGKIWSETIYQDGKPWKAVLNCTLEGKKRNPGTLNKGNGTLIYYNEDNSIRETEKYKNGILQE